MPNGGPQRRADEAELIEVIEEEGGSITLIPQTGSSRARQQMVSTSLLGLTLAGRSIRETTMFISRYRQFMGDIHVFSQQKSEYYETTSQEGVSQLSGVCPSLRQG